MGFRTLASATGPPGPCLARSGPVLGFLAAPTHGVGGDSGRLRHDGDPARTQFRGLRAQPQPPLKLGHMRSQHHIPSRHRCGQIRHSTTVDPSRQKTTLFHREP